MQLWIPRPQPRQTKGLSPGLGLLPVQLPRQVLVNQLGKALRKAIQQRALRVRRQADADRSLIWQQSELAPRDDVAPCSQK